MNEEQKYPNEWGQNQASQGPPPPPPDYSQPQQQGYPPQQPYQQQQGYPPQQQSYQQQPYQQPQQQGYPPQGYGPPPKKSNTGLIVGIVVAVAAVAVVIILLMVFMNPFAPPIVGKWHITSVDINSSYGNQHQSIDGYIEFHSDGTGKSYGTFAYGSSEGTFHWKSTGNNQIEIQDENSTVSVTMTYHINGNNLDLSFSYAGTSVTYHGVRA